MSKTSDDLACLIRISAKEIQGCHRIMDIQELVRKKILEAHDELLQALLPEVLTG